MEIYCDVCMCTLHKQSSATKAHGGRHLLGSCNSSRMIFLISTFFCDVLSEPYLTYFNFNAPFPFFFNHLSFPQFSPLCLKVHGISWMLCSPGSSPRGRAPLCFNYSPATKTPFPQRDSFTKFSFRNT